MRTGTVTINDLPVGEALLGRVLNAAGEPIDGRGALAEAPRRALRWPGGRREPAGTPLEMGIKVVDLFAPLARGGIAGIFSGIGVGKMVLLNEMIHNLATRHHGYSMILGLEDRTYEVNDLMDVLREQGVQGYATVIFGRRDERAEAYSQVVLAGLTVAEHFREQGRDVLLFVDQQLAQEIDPLNLYGVVGEGGSITTIVFGEEDETGIARLAPHLDNVIRFSVDLAKQQIWPAVDPLASRSMLLERVLVDDEHLRTARQAAAILQRYAGLKPMPEESRSDLSEEDRRLIARARRIQRFQSQPFSVAEPYTAMPGTYVTLAETIRSFRELVEGRYDDLPEEAFSFVGTIDQALQKAVQQGRT